MKLILICILMTLLQSCATQRYGRMCPVVPTEARTLDCTEIDIEIEKCNAFISETNNKNQKFTGCDVLSFLGDFGIGDAMEVSDAVSSATKRLTQLEKLKREKCYAAIKIDNGKKLLGYQIIKGADGKQQTVPVYED